MAASAQPMTIQKISGEQLEQLRRAGELHRPLARAASLARGNGRSLLAFGLLSVILAVPSWDPAGVAIGAVLIVTGSIEVRTSPRLSRGDPSAPALLARNELALMAGIVLFCILKLTVLRESGEDLAKQLGGRARSLGIDVEALTSSLGTVTYAICIAVTLLYQGGLARYFLRRRPMIDTYTRESPEWARDLVSELRD